MQHVGPSSLTRDRTPAPCIRSTDSSPLDCQGSPKEPVFMGSGCYCHSGRSHLRGMGNIPPNPENSWKSWFSIHTPSALYLGDRVDNKLQLRLPWIHQALPTCTVRPVSVPRVFAPCGDVFLTSPAHLRFSAGARSTYQYYGIPASVGVKAVP